MKFWLHITHDEQLRRFKERETAAYKHWKLTDEDWRNREQWDDYERAVNDMVERTSTRQAPWTLVEANDKYFARLKVLDDCLRPAGGAAALTVTRGTAPVRTTGAAIDGCRTGEPASVAAFDRHQQRHRPGDVHLVPDLHFGESVAILDPAAVLPAVRTGERD